jgi:hypothetical protein
MSDVFLSYAPSSAKQADMLAAELQALGISTWLPGKEIQPGDERKQKTREGIQQARAVVFLVDGHWLASESARHETMAALELSWSDERKILLPVLFGEVDAPSFLRHILGIKMQAGNRDWPRVAKEIAKILAEGKQPKHSKAAVKEQSERLNLIEKQANSLRAFELDQRKNTKII